MRRSQLDRRSLFRSRRVALAREDCSLLSKMDTDALVHDHTYARYSQGSSFVWRLASAECKTRGLQIVARVDPMIADKPVA